MSGVDAVALAQTLRAACPGLSEADIAIAVATALAGTTSGPTDARPPAPTVSEFVDRVRTIYASREAGRVLADIGDDGSLPLHKTTTLRTYETHWRRLVASHGGQPINELTQIDLEVLVAEAGQKAQASARQRNASRVARGAPARVTRSVGARNTCVTALRVVFSRAMDEGLIERDPSARLKHETKPASPRHAITLEQFDEVLEVVATGGDDPELDFMIVWMLAETACRREAVLNLTMDGLRDTAQAIELHEKNDQPRIQPVTIELLTALRVFAVARGSRVGTDRVFHYHPDGRGRGRALTAKRFETLFKRVQRSLPWALELGLSAHWLRHTTLTWCERSHGLAVARAFAGHRGGPVTLSYVKPDFSDVASALSSLTGRPHPAAVTSGQ